MPISSDALVGLLVLAAFLFVIGLLVFWISTIERKRRDRIVQLRNDEFACNGMSVQDFLYERSLRKGDAVGVYILFNRDRDMYYVGQSKRIYFRVNQHFTGHGNGDVYADYKYGDEFMIKLIPLVDSGYSDIDALERDKIEEFSANATGYNRTRGNR